MAGTKISSLTLSTVGANDEVPIRRSASNFKINLRTAITQTLAASNLGSLGASSSSQLAALLSDETGSGAAVFNIGPTITSATLVTPNLGTPTAGVLTNCTGLPLTTGTTGTLPTSKGGTGLNAIGSAFQVLRVNAGGTALEYAANTVTSSAGGFGALDDGKALVFSNGGDINAYEITLGDETSRNGNNAAGAVNVYDSAGHRVRLVAPVLGVDDLELLFPSGGTQLLSDADKSEGGNTSADSGKLVVFNSNGGLSARDITLGKGTPTRARGFINFYDLFGNTLLLRPNNQLSDTSIVVTLPHEADCTLLSDLSKSFGGNGSADEGLVATYDGSGGLTAYSVQADNLTANISILVGSPVGDPGVIALYDSGGTYTGSFITATLSAVRTWTLPDSSGTVILDNNPTFTASSSIAWSGRAGLRSPADAQVSIRNNANSAYGVLLALNEINAVTSTATAGGTTTLTTSSARNQIFTGTSNQNVTLTAANAYGAGLAGQFTIKNRSTGTITINRAGSDTIDGATSITLAANEAVQIISDGVSEWVIVAKYKSGSGILLES